MIPCTLVERILYTYHDTIANCHGGVDATLEKCRRKFYFYKMKNEFKLYIAACLTCNRNKQPTAFLKAPLKPIVYSEFGQAIAIDHLEPSKKATARGVVAMLTIVDMYSNYLVCVPVKSLNTDISIKVVLEHWLLKHGMPEVILHDLGKAFTSGIFQAVMKIFDIKDTRTTSYHSQCNGRAESQNRRINIAMRVSLSDEQWKDYDLWIKYIVFTLNSLASTRTGYSANFLVFGRELRMPRDLFLKDDDRLEKIRSDITENDYKKLQVYSLYKQISEVTRKVRDNAQKRAMYMCKQYDKHVRGPYFNKGDLCFLLINAPKHKYADKWAGPYLITEKLSDWNYIVDVKGVKKVVSISKMKAYKPNKYSQLNAEGMHGKIPKDNNKCYQKLNTRKRQESSDSSDDENWIITVGDPQLRKCTRNNPTRTSRGAKVAGKTYTDDSVQEFQPRSGVPQTIDQREEIISRPADHTAEEINETPSDLDTSGLSDQDFLDAREALNEANMTREHVSSSRSSQSRDFGNIDNQNIVLSDIQRHEKEMGLKNPISNATAGGLSRSSTIHDLPRSSTSYNLRPRPKKVKKFGSPVSALKKLTKSKKR